MSFNYLFGITSIGTYFYYYYKKSIIKKNKKIENKINLSYSNCLCENCNKIQMENNSNDNSKCLCKNCKN